MRSAITTSIWLLLAVSCAAETITVDDDGPADFNNIQAAIDDANDGDTVEIQPGTYTGSGNRDINFLGKAITVRSIDPNDPNIVAATVVDCNDSGGGFCFQNDEDANSVLDGLTIISGEILCRGSGGRVQPPAGSPTIKNCRMMSSRISFSDKSSPVIIDCIFTNNLGIGMRAIHCYGSYSDTSLTISGCVFTDFFGAISCWGLSNLTITDCLFTNNSSDKDGGAIRCRECSNLTITDCLFADNSANRGGAIFIEESTSTIDIQRCVFRNNSSTMTGGAVRINAYVSDTTTITATVSDCIFQDNSAWNGGGGINAQESCELTVTNCLFVGNFASKTSGWLRSYGGAVFTGPRTETSLMNCLLVGNSAEHGGALGGAITDIAIANCTFAGNTANRGNTYEEWHATDSSTVHIKDCIIWDGENSLVNPDGETFITSSNIFGGWAGEGNIDVDPCFADPGYWDPNGTLEDVNDDFWVDGDYHLKSQAGRWDANEGQWVIDDVTSPCIDAGDAMSPIGHEPFPNGGMVNMGAYGGTAGASKSYFGGAVCETIAAGDVDGDCIVDFRDVSIMLLHWLEGG